MSHISAQPTNKHMECIDYKFANRENSKTVTAKNQSTTSESCETD
jgi:hypothetical protein